jgi:hypothetical protein
MARKNFGVEIQEENAEGVRTITMTITATSDDFVLADLLAERKAISSCPSLLKTAALDAVKTYLGSVNAAISGMKSEPKTEAPAAEQEAPKRGRTNREHRPKERADPAPKVISGEATLTASSGD